MADATDRKAVVELGEVYTELNTILGRIRRRSSGEPTTRERERIAELREKLRVLKQGGDA